MKISKKGMLMLVICLLAVGFASVSTTLMLTGTVGVGVKDDDFNVMFVSADIDGGVASISDTSKKGDTLTFSTPDISKVNEPVTLNYMVYNNSTQYASDVSIKCYAVNDPNGYLNTKISVVGVFGTKSIIFGSSEAASTSTEAERINAQETKNGTITVALTEQILTETTLSVSCKLIATGASADEIAEPNLGLTSYGVKREIASSSSAWERVGLAEGLVANAYSYANAYNLVEDKSSVQNDFDDIYPWSDIITVDLNRDGTENSRYDGTDEWFTNATGEIMTYIPEFYYKRYQSDGYEYVYITQNNYAGFEKSDAFYIGRYTISSGTHSKSGTNPLNYVTLKNYRTSATSLGKGWQLMDYHYFIIQLLYLVEYADYNSQAILGQGSVNGSLQSSGGCNVLGMKSGMKNFNNVSSVIYRGIEDIFGNWYQFIDGFRVKSTKFYISYTPSSYASNDLNDYIEISYSGASSKGFISKLGYDANNPLVAFPTEVSGSASTYITDYYKFDAGIIGGAVGGGYGSTSNAGLWFYSFDMGPESSISGAGARLLKTI